jgi:hypothetical protein
MTHLKWVQHGGGRAAAGFQGKAGDCVARSIAIATGGLTGPLNTPQQVKT